MFGNLESKQVSTENVILMETKNLLLLLDSKQSYIHLLIYSKLIYIYSKLIYLLVCAFERNYMFVALAMYACFYTFHREIGWVFRFF